MSQPIRSRIIHMQALGDASVMQLYAADITAPAAGVVESFAQLEARLTSGSVFAALSYAVTR